MPKSDYARGLELAERLSLKISIPDDLNNVHFVARTLLTAEELLKEAEKVIHRYSQDNGAEIGAWAMSGKWLAKRSKMNDPNTDPNWVKEDG